MTARSLAQTVRHIGAERLVDQLGADDARDVKRSGGSQQRSRWQSAEIISYFMAASLAGARSLGKYTAVSLVNENVPGHCYVKMSSPWS